MGTFDTEVLKVIMGSFGAFLIFEKTLCRKPLVVARKGVKFGPQGWVSSVNRVLLTFQWLRSFWGHSVHSNFRQACVSKMAGRRAKWSEIWASVVSIQCTQGTFALKSFKVILGSLGAFPIFEKPISRKRLVVEWSGVKFGSQDWVFSVYRVLLTLK